MEETLSVGFRINNGTSLLASGSLGMGDSTMQGGTNEMRQEKFL